MKHPFKKQQPQPNRRQESGRLRSIESENDHMSFRRNRTITGSTSSRIASSNELNADVRSPRAKVHHLSKRRRHIVLRLTMVVIAALATYLILSQLVAETIVVRRSNANLPVSLKNQYSARIDRYFGAHPTERFFPWLQSADLTAYLQAEYPEIKAAQVALTGDFGKAQISLELRRPVVRWDIDDQQQFVDASGVVFNHNGYANPSVRIIDKSGSLPTAHGLVTSHRFLGFVGLIVGDMKARGYTVSKATIPALTTRQLEISVRHVSYHFKLTVDRSAGEQSEDMTRIITYLKKHRIHPGYVDVRVKGKAFYK